MKVIVVLMVSALLLLSGCAETSFTSTITDPTTGIVTQHSAQWSSFAKQFDGLNAKIGDSKISAIGSKSDTQAIVSLIDTVNTLLMKGAAGPLGLAQAQR